MIKMSSTVFSLVACSAALAFAQDVGGSQGGQATTQPGTGEFANAADSEFVMTAHSINALEVKLGKLAQGRGSKQAVKDFGKMLEKDHSLAQKQLEDSAPKAGLDFPREMSPAHKSIYDKLSSLSGTDFDAQFIDKMVVGHQDAVATFEQELREGNSAVLRSYASAQLPVLRRHLQVAKEEQKGLAEGAPAH
jgi:putative membrane protein